MSSQVTRSTSRGQLPTRCKSATSRSIYSAPSDEQLRPYLELARTGSAMPHGRCSTTTTSIASVRSSNSRQGASPGRGWCSPPDVPVTGSVTGTGSQGGEFISVPCASADTSTSRRASADSDQTQTEEVVVDLLPVLAITEDCPTGCPSLAGSMVESLNEAAVLDREEREEADLEEQRELQASQPVLNYAEQLKKYSWRMEVHGDPLHMKLIACS